MVCTDVALKQGSILAPDVLLSGPLCWDTIQCFTWGFKHFGLHCLHKTRSILAFGSLISSLSSYPVRWKDRTALVMESWFQSLIYIGAKPLCWCHVIQDHYHRAEDWCLSEATKLIQFDSSARKNRQNLCLWTEIMFHLRRNNFVGGCVGCATECVLCALVCVTDILKFLGCDFQTCRAFPQTCEIQREALWNLFRKKQSL